MRPRATSFTQRATVMVGIAAVTFALAMGVAACGDGGARGEVGSLRSSLAAQRSRVAGIAAELGATLSRAGPRPDALLADEFAALGTRAEQEAATIEGLTHPPGYNTRLRDLRSALVAVANGLSRLSTAATEHQVGTARTAMRALREDGSTLRGTYASVARSLGLAPG